MKAADRVWHKMVALVMETRDPWRRKVVAAMGMPFSRFRALWRIADAGAISLSDLAEALVCDAPAATVAVNDLEKRRFAQRRPHPDDRRIKLVSLTPAGQTMLTALRKIEDTAPEGFAKLGAAEIARIEALLDRV